MMFFEPYNEAKHGRCGLRTRLANDAWADMFEQATRIPVVVRGTQRQTIHYAAARLGYKAEARMLADIDGYVVTARKLS